MPIQPSDIKLLESERMRDTADGGGRMTGRVIPSGEAGNVFPKVSRVDSVYGRVNLRKIYVAVRTATLDMYAGAHAIITDAPYNDRISCCLFSTGSAFDNRTTARDRIESYVVAGPFSRLRLYGNQLVGQRAILCYQREEEPLPDVGEVLVLSVEAIGYTAAAQYVRITDVTHEVRTFTDAVGDYRRRVVTMKIGSTLSQTFPGAEVSRYSADGSPTKVRVTQVADASRYYGIQPLAEPALAGALTLRLGSVYAPLVPSTQRETAVSLAGIAGARPVQPSATEYFVERAVTREEITTQNPGAGGTGHGVIYLSRPAAFGSVSVGGYVEVDGLVTGPAFTAVVNHVDGLVEVTITHGSQSPPDYVVRFLPASPVSHPAHTRQIPITLGTRGAVYAETLNPLPAPGTLIVDFRALGRWYRLRDNGNGELVANDPSEGTGSAAYDTGALVITLGALPDVGSAVLISWGTPAHYAIRAGDTTDASTAFDLEFTLDHAPVVPGSVTLTYPVGGVPRDVTDPAANGVLAGTDASGTIDYATGAVRLVFSTPPDRAANLSSAYTWRDGADLYSGTAAVISGGQFTVPGVAPFRNGGTMVFSISHPNGANLDAPAYITPGGQVRVRQYGDRSGNSQSVYAWLDQSIGVFDAATGIVTITGPVAGNTKEWGLTGADWAWSQVNAVMPIVGVANISVERDTAAFNPQAVTDEALAVSATGLQLDLTATVADSIVAGSVMFTATGKTYVDRNGTLYCDLDPTTGAGLAAGSIDYSTGICSLSFWADSTSVSRVVKACLTQYGEWTAIEMGFRTAGSPIRPASLYVQCTTADGDLISGTADQNGVISGTWMRGTVEQTMGVVSVEFGQMSGGEWAPREVQPVTIRYNSVVFTNLPLEASILGLDPVRLPADGRVPIYRPGDVVVIHHTERTAIPAPVAGGTYSAGRAGLATLRLEDDAGDEVSGDRYVPNLAAGTVTLAADWTGADGVAPLSIVHRIEDMSLLADVQITGNIGLTAPTTQDFPVGTQVSSALLYGDLQSLVTNLFDQATWTAVWSDVLIGSQANAQYDDINYPVEILNESAVTERWRINFTSTTAFALIGENLGQIATGTIAADLAPINPVTGEAYFFLRSGGWGGGWGAGNQLRFNTVGANGPTWIARTILAGAALEGDSFDLEARGDVD